MVNLVSIAKMFYSKLFYNASRVCISFEGKQTVHDQIFAHALYIVLELNKVMIAYS